MERKTRLQEVLSEIRENFEQATRSHEMHCSNQRKKVDDLEKQLSQKRRKMIGSGTSYLAREAESERAWRIAQYNKRREGSTKLEIKR